MQDKVEGKRPAKVSASLGAEAPHPADSPLLLDTHVLLDLWVFGHPGLQGLALQLPGLRWTATAEMVTEWHYMMRRGIGRFASRSPDDLTQPTVLPKPSQPAPWRSRDPDDQMFLDLAHTLRPCLLWTRDRALLAHRKRAALAGVFIETPESAMSRLGWT